MRSAVILCSIILGLLERTCSFSSNGGLKGASIFDFPYLASIEANSQYACAATIVDDKYVMTTYSCVQGIDINSLAVRVGTSKQGQRGVYFKVVEVRPWHGNPYIGSSPKVDYDIAMVKIALSFSYTPQVMWANPNADGIQDFQEGSLIGWVDTKRWGGPLTSAKAYVMPSSNCSQIYAGVMNISAYMYCLWPVDPTISPCFADKGVPFYLNEQFYGMVTHAPGCDSPQLPVVITGIAKFTSFIIMVLCDLESIFNSSLQNQLKTFVSSHSAQPYQYSARQSL